MECRDVRIHLVDHQRGRLLRDREADVRAHLAECVACSRTDAAERTLTELLERRLPQHPAPIRLKRSLALMWPPPEETGRSWWGRWGRVLGPAGAVALAVLAATPLYLERTAAHRAAAATMVTEAVNDHLRILQSGYPLEVESGNLHQVKPWFEGRLDFAPAVAFLGDDEFPLRGGSLAYFLDRRAAVFVYGRRLHAISLFVFRAEGLRWTERGTEALGSARAREATSRGFHVILWRAGELGYALVSDADPADVRRLALKLTGGT